MFAVILLPKKKKENQGNGLECSKIRTGKGKWKDIHNMWANMSEGSKEGEKDDGNLQP